MDANLPVKKLFRLAAYTSPVIALLAIGAVSVVPILFMKTVATYLFFLFLGVASVVIFCFWSMNIALVLFFSRKGRSTSLPLRYVLSYVMPPLFMLLIRFIALHFVDERALLNITASGNTVYFIYIMRVSIILSVNTIILVLLDLLLLREKKTVMEAENASLKMKNIEAQNQQLKQQIHPHFLFNSLNTLKALIKRNPGDAEDYLVKLSDYLRVSISFGQVNTVRVEDELKLCTDYLAMQQMRFGKALQTEIEVPEQVRQCCSIPVFSLQTLLENAIKHNALTAEAPLLICIGYKEGEIEVRNNRKQKQTTEAGSRFGLANLTERHKILTGSEPLIRSTDAEFSVTIKVIANEARNH